MYMSGPLLRYPRKPNHLFDDLISFIYVLEIMGLRFHIHSLSSRKLVKEGSTVKLTVDMEENKANTAFAGYLQDKFLSQYTSNAGSRKILESRVGKPSFRFMYQDGLAWLLTEFYKKLQPYFLATDQDEWVRKWGDELDSFRSVVQEDKEAATAWQDMSVFEDIPEETPSDDTATRQRQGRNLLDLTHVDILKIWRSIPAATLWSKDKTPDQFSNLPNVYAVCMPTGPTASKSKRESTSSSKPFASKKQKLYGQQSRASSSRSRLSDDPFSG